MNFKDIPQFPHADYHITVHWRYLKRTIEMLGDGIGYDLEPPYQRGFKWDEKQKVAYLEYMLKGGLSGRDIYWNAANWQRYADVGILELVDGQQRVKTVLAFLDNKIPVFGGHYYKEFDDVLPVHFDFYINNLTSQKEVVEWYLGLNTGGSIHTEEDLRPAFDYLKELEQTNL